MAVFYISPTGNDTTGDGSYGNPWLTPNKASASSSQGDTIVWKDGLYTLTSDYSMGALQERYHFAENRYQAVISMGIYEINSYSVTDSLFESFVFQDGANVTTAKYNLVARNLGGLILRDCIIKDSTTGKDNLSGVLGVYRTSGSGPERLTLDKCLIYNISKGTVNSFYVIKPYSVTSTIIIKDTTIVLNKTGTDAITGLIRSAGGTNTITAVNSTFANHSGATADINFATLENSNCDFYNWSATGFPTLGSGSDTTDPMFENVSTLNFRYRKDSPWRGVGTLT